MDPDMASQKLRRDIAHRDVEPVGYLDTVSATSFAKQYKALSYEAMGARAGARLLDVGCGPGDDALAMARLVQPGGCVYGVDLNARMVAEAWRRSGHTGLAASFQVCDARHLPFETGMFDGVRCDRVLQHLDQPELVLAEMARVTKPGGRIVAVEPDWDTFTIDVPARSVSRKVADYMAERSVRSGWIGRQLYRILRELRMQSVEVRATSLVLTDLHAADSIWGLSRHAREAVAVGMISDTERQEWQGQLQAADAAGKFFSAACGYLVRATKPMGGE